MYTKLRFLLLFLLISIVTFGSDSLSVRKMHEDINYYFKTLKEVNPNLYVRYNEMQFDSVQTIIKSSCREPMTKQQFLFRIGLVNKLTEEHTAINGLIQNNNFRVINNIEFKDGKIYYNNREILSIGGISVKEIYPNVDGLVSWAYSNQERQRFLQRVTPNVLKLYGLDGPQYEAEVKSGNNIEKIEIKSTLYEFAWSYYLKEIPYMDSTFHDKTISMRFNSKESIGVLYYNSSEQDSEKEIQKASEKFFKTVESKEIKNIIIDVSMNGGGSDWVHKCILKYLRSESYEVKGKAYATRYGVMSIESFYKDPRYKNAIEEMKNVAEQGTKEFSETHKGNNSGYDGKVFVIMGSQTYSSAYAFCENIKRGKSGILVGEAAGQRSPFIGTILDFSLPNSGIEFTCGAYSYISEPIITDKEGFLQPDIPYKMDHPLDWNDYKKIIDSNNSSN